MKTSHVQLLLAVCITVLVSSTVGLASRNASGTYSLPAGNPVVQGTTISPTVHNNTTSDFATEMTDSLNRSGKGAMLAPLQGYVGTVSLPGYTFSGDTDTGLYRVGADSIGIAAGAALRATVDTNGLTIGSAGTGIALSVAGCASLDFAGTTDTCESLTITVTGAAVTYPCILATPTALPSANSWVFCFVSAADTVTVRHCSHGATGNPAAATYCARVIDP